MASIITAGLTISSNPRDFATASSAGPLSVALSLSTTTPVSTDIVENRSYTVPIDSGSDASFDGTVLLDGSARAESNGANADGVTGDPYAPGTMGCYVYVKNTGDTNKVAIGLTKSSVADVDGTTNLAYDATPYNAGGGLATGLSGLTGKTLRTMTLKPGEFAFFPFDYTGDLIAEALTGTTTVDLWIFDRL